MTELVLYARTLPEPLFKLIPTEKIKIRKDKDEIRIIPIQETKNTSNCPFLGFYTDGKLTVDGFLERKHQDKELED